MLDTQRVFTYSFVKKEEAGRIAFKKKTNNPLHTAVGKARKSLHKSVKG